jgi:threonine aldolase
MIFSSDNWTGAAPQVSAALARHADGLMPAYGTSDLEKQVEQRFSEIFEREVAVLYVATGTAANALALSLAMKPGGIALAHAEAHVVEDECGAPELFMGSGRIELVPGSGGKISQAGLARALERYDPPFLHHGRAIALTITQATEAGTVYTLEETAALAAAARRLGLQVHMDGARFANAVAALGATPAEMTWKAGVDMLSFGGTKNGCWCAEALVLFDASKRGEAEYLRKRVGHLFSKSRFVSAQFLAYLDNNLWLDMAAHANSMADMLREGVRAKANARLAWESQANELFCVLDRRTEKRLREAGGQFYEWHTPGWMAQAPSADEAVFRLVTSHATTPQHVESFLSALG